MSPAVLSLVALLLAIALSFSSRVNVGIPALALAWLLSVVALDGKPETLAAAFPASLFLTLLGVTLLFAVADANGSLERMAERAVRLARGDRRLVPWVLFSIALTASAVGPGAISAVALVAPLAVPVARRLGLPLFLTVLMVVNGANAGNLSPLSAVGIIANTKMAEAGLGGHEARVFAVSFLAHLFVTAVVYLVWLARSRAAGGAAATPPSGPVEVSPLDRAQRITLAFIAAWVVGAVAYRLPVGFSAFAAVVGLLALRAADETAALKRVPWGAIVMVCGVSTLVALAEKTGGIDLMSALIARLSTPSTVNGVVAFVTGLISTWSSTSGVVLPAFLPTVPALVARLQGGDPLAISLSINVGSSLVDVSPLSTLGALGIAAVGDPVAARGLFRQLLAWGLSMTLVGALLCQLFAPALAGLRGS